MLQARILLILCTVIWGWTFIATRLCLPYVTPWELLGLRSLIALPSLFLILRFKKRTVSLQGLNRGRILLAAGIFSAHLLIQITGLKYTSATNTSWIVAVSPLVMAALSFVILKERLTNRTLFGMFVATAGILLLVSRGQLNSLAWLSSVGDWLILLSTHTWALFTIVIRDVARKRDPLSLTIVVLAPAAVTIPTVMLFTSDWGAIANMPAHAWLALGFLGVFGSALAHWFWQIGVARVGASQAGVYIFIEPLATTALAAPYLHEYFGWPTAIGGSLVLAGVYYAVFSRSVFTRK